MEKIDINLILAKLRSKQDRINFMRETGNKNINVLGFYVPGDRGFDFQILYSGAKGRKNGKGSIIYITAFANRPNRWSGFPLDPEVQ